MFKVWCSNKGGKLEQEVFIMKIKQVNFFGKTETVLTGSKEPEFIFRARNSYRPERKLWDFK